MQTPSAMLPTIHPAWRAFLESQGAKLADREVQHYGNPDAERAAAASGDIVTDLSHHALLRADGQDAETFLQGQLSNDIRLVTDSRAQLSSYCNPKGRMLAIFLIARRAETYYLQLPAALADSVLRRLRMFILRARVKLEPAEPEFVSAGIAGPNAERLVQGAMGALPAQTFDSVTAADVTVIRLPGPHPRFEFLATVDRMQTLWGELTSGGARPVGAGPWAWLDIQAAVPTVLPGTVEEFVPQMTNLEVVGGVSFSKGCYPGQEIVARMHYLGRLKQRMFPAHVAVITPPAPGTPLYAPDLPSQSSGAVVSAQPSPQGGCDLLAVLHLSSAETADIRLGDPSGPSVQLRALPYPLPAETAKDRSR